MGHNNVQAKSETKHVYHRQKGKSNPDGPQQCIGKTKQSNPHTKWQDKSKHQTQEPQTQVDRWTTTMRGQNKNNQTQMDSNNAQANTNQTHMDHHMARQKGKSNPDGPQQSIGKHKKSNPHGPPHGQTHVKKNQIGNNNAKANTKIKPA